MRLITVGLLAAVATLVGCGGNRELVGNWTAVNTADVPSGMERLMVPDSTHINLTDGKTLDYEVLENNNVRIKFPSGDTFTYSYSRSGENLTLVDAGKKLLYVRDQQ